MAVTNVKERLMQIAIQRFATHGYEATTMRSIASRAGVTLPTLYHYFGDKKNLFQEVCLITFAPRAERGLTGFEKSAAPTECKVMEFFVGLADELLNNENYFKLMHREIIDQDREGIRKLTERCWNRPFATLCLAYRALLPKGTDVATVAFTSFSLIFGLIEFRRKAPFLHESLSKHYEPAALAELVLATTVPSIDWRKFPAQAA